MDFYSSVTHDGFAAELFRLSNKWNDIRNFADAFAAKYGQDFFDCITINKDKANDFLDDEKLKFLNSKIGDLEKNFNFHGFSLIKRLIISLNDKCSRFKKKKYFFDRDGCGIQFYNNSNLPSLLFHYQRHV